MKRLLMIAAFALSLATPVLCQMRIIYPDNVVAISAPAPSFPAEAKELIYGDEIRVLVDIDALGKVKAALPHWPLVPCSNLSDPVVTEIRKAALTAVRASLFEPVKKDGKAVDERLSIGYRLRPLTSPLSEQERKIVSIGVANGRATALEKPEYPEAAKPAGLRGSIMVQVLIDEGGKVVSAGAISGHPQFAASGMKAACKARFNPMTLRNEPAKMLGAITYNFAP
jgi:TonB family protein